MGVPVEDSGRGVDDLDNLAVGRRDALGTEHRGGRRWSAGVSAMDRTGLSLSEIIGTG